MELIRATIWQASEGKVFKNKITGVIGEESIIANAPIIENGGVNYYPIYYMCLMDTQVTETFTKTVAGVSTGADAYVFSDEPETLYVGDTTHTFDVSQDSETSEGWKCRYVIAYATEANATDANGIHISMPRYTNALEFIGSQYLKLKSTSALFGSSSFYNRNLMYLNLSNSSFVNDTISGNYFCMNCYSLVSLSLPSVTTISGDFFCNGCTSLVSLSLPSVTTISGYSFCMSCYSLVSLSLPSVTTISGDYFCMNCASLVSLSLPSVTTISGDYFCYNCYGLKSLLLPYVTTISGDSFCNGCTSLVSLSLPSVTTISGIYFCYNCYGLKSLLLPYVITISGYSFCNGCTSLKYFEIPNTITTLTSTTANTLNFTEFIELPTDFDISACNFTGDTGHNKSLAWFTHLATQLKDNSGGTAKTMVIGAANIALIPTDTATIISNKNWTLS